MLVIKTGTANTAIPALAALRRDFEAWIGAGAGLPDSEIEVVHVFLDEPLPEPESVPAVVITGSPAMVTDRAEWSERTAQWLRKYVALGRPVLGICYGHQLLAHALGGEVANNPRGREIGTTDVQLHDDARLDPLFAELERTLHVPVCHAQAVTKLPEGATLLGATSLDPNHAFRFGQCAWGVQFHPEFDAEIVRGYIEARREQIVAEGLDADALQAAAIDTAHGTDVLRRFGQIAKLHAQREREKQLAAQIRPDLASV